MKPNDIYRSPVRDSEHRIYPLEPFLQSMGMGYTNLPDVSSERIETREHFVQQHPTDEEGFIKTSSVWLDDHPVMILREADGDKGPFNDIVVTDGVRFAQLIVLLTSLKEHNPVHDPDVDLADLDTYAGQTMEYK